MKEKIQLSIILTCFMRPHLLKWCLLSLTKQKILSPYEIIVVNDGLEDETSFVCKSYPNLPIKYIFTGNRNYPQLKWRVPGYAINIGVKHARGNKIIIGCAEMFLMDNLVQKIIYHLYENPKNIVITQGKDDQQGKFLKHLVNSNGNSTDQNYDILSMQLNTKFPFFLGLTKKVFFDIGGYDEDFTGYCYDDADFVDRLVKNGGTYLQLPCRVVH
ncbi:MAG: glycosyltransferase family 2 protein, partial [Candidatus Margulisbacteria bacterium]|nr:glycosyltransferase family 2 protein [Candidatus Margulisiibacteriota bacterium]